MKTRDLVFICTGAFLVFSGIFLMFIWDLAAGISALLLLGMLILILLILQRRQVAKLQQRVLNILRSATDYRLAAGASMESKSVSDVSSSQRFDQATIKKILGLLHAQQMSMEELDKRLSEISERNASKGAE